MSKPIILLLSLLASVSIAACANNATSQDVAPTAHDESVIEPARTNEPLIIIPAKQNSGSVNDQRAQAFYLLMQAELAGQHGKISEAGKLYLQAAQLGRDPRTAERAAKIALLAHDSTTSDQALALWIELEPHNEARWPMEALLAVRAQQDEQALALVTQHLPKDAAGRDAIYKQLLSVLINEGPSILPLLHRLAQSNPNDAEAWFTLAQAALHFKEQETARIALRKTIQLDPKRKDAYLLLADSYFSQKDNVAGIEVLSNMVQQFPKDRQLRMTYARALHEAGRSEEARNLLTKMLQRTPGDNDLRFAVALLALETGDYKTAERELRVLHRQPERANTAAYYLGRLEEQRGQNAAANAWYAQIKEGEFVSEALLRQALIDMAQGRVDDAHSKLSAARAQSTSDEERVRFYLLEAELLRKAQHQQLAYDLLTQALTEYAGEPDLLYSRAMVAEQLNMPAQSEADLRAILAQDPEKPEALNALGFTLAERNTKLDEAYTLIAKALKFDPKNAATIDSMGWVLYRQGKLAEAESYLRQAYTLNQDAEIAGHLVVVLAALNRHEEAMALLAEALKREPSNPELLKLDMQPHTPTPGATLPAPVTSTTPE
jgi:tetratricopeptide (TPR) repeat protein